MQLRASIHRLHKTIVKSHVPFATETRTIPYYLKSTQSRLHLYAVQHWYHAIAIRSLLHIHIAKTQMSVRRPSFYTIRAESATAQKHATLLCVCLTLLMLRGAGVRASALDVPGEISICRSAFLGVCFDHQHGPSAG